MVTQLELAFETKFLRELCEDESTATKVLGAAVAKTLQRRLADLRAATTIDDVIAGKTKTDTELITLELTSEAKIVLRANHKTNPTRDGKINWDKVTRVQITRIADRK